MDKDTYFVLGKFVKTCRELNYSLENEDEGDDYELEAGEEGSMIVQDVKDNSAFVFKEHTSE
jgi:hypothetical protein